MTESRADQSVAPPGSGRTRRARPLGQQVVDLLGLVADELLAEEGDLLVELPHLAFGDLLGDLRGLAAVLGLGLRLRHLERHELRGEAGLVDRHRGGDVGGDVLADAGGDVLGQVALELEEDAELRVVVDVSAEASTAHLGAAGHGDVLAGRDAHVVELLGLGVVERDVAVRSVERGRGDGLGHLPEALVAGREVGLRPHLEDGAPITVDRDRDASLAGGAVGAGVHLPLELLAEGLLGGGGVAAGLDEGLLAIHHPKAGLPAEGHHVLRVDVGGGHLRFRRVWVR